MTTPRFINLNADLGESFGAWHMGDDAALLALVNSANVACGFHAGDPLVMQRTLGLARAQGVSVGAHPSFPDLQGFGRRRMAFRPEEITALVSYQVGALQALGRAAGQPVSHVKPHGALSNWACEDPEVARAVALAVQAVQEPGQPLILLAPALSALEREGRALGLTVACEIYADRRLAEDGQLLPRSHPQALIHAPEEAVRHVLAMLEAQALITLSGQRLPCTIHSVCVHGDEPQAVQTARALVQALAAQGWQRHTLPTWRAEEGATQVPAAERVPR